jgi:hypothetical protein
LSRSLRVRLGRRKSIAKKRAVDLREIQEESANPTGSADVPGGEAVDGGANWVAAGVERRPTVVNP